MKYIPVPNKNTFDQRAEMPDELHPLFPTALSKN
jgi:hypothetical protein